MKGRGKSETEQRFVQLVFGLTLGKAQAGRARQEALMNRIQVALLRERVWVGLGRRALRESCASLFSVNHMQTPFGGVASAFDDEFDSR